MTNILNDVKKAFSLVRMIPFVLMTTVTTGCFSKSKEEMCTPLLQRILDVQQIRKVVREDFHITMKDYKEGRLSAQAWEESKKGWFEKENKMAAEADKLYGHAYDTGCLD